MTDEEKMKIEEEEKLRAKVRYEEQQKLQLQAMKSPLFIVSMILVVLGLVLGGGIKLFFP